MRVVCFIIQDLKCSGVIDKIHKEFGKNIPNYLQYEGGKGCNYLCCVDSQINFQDICKKYDITIDYPYYMEIDKDKYNDNYTIHPTYTKEDPHFELEPNHPMDHL